MNDPDLLPPTDARNLLHVVVEIPAGTRHKCEFRPGAAVFALNRVLHSAVSYPADYGFIPGTLADDGDPLDALVLVSHPTFAGCLLRARPLGHLEMLDGGVPDAKLLCTAYADPHYQEVKSLADLSPHCLQELADFFLAYKRLEPKRVELGAWQGLEATYTLIARSIERAKCR
jgi:inorganic pyrophosphatase